MAKSRYGTTTARDLSTTNGDTEAQRRQRSHQRPHSERIMKRNHQSSHIKKEKKNLLLSLLEGFDTLLHKGDILSQRKMSLKVLGPVGARRT